MSFLWSDIVSYILTAITAVFNWAYDIFNGIPGSWDTVFTLFVIIMASRFILGPFLGSVLNTGSDRARRKRSSKSEDE